MFNVFTTNGEILVLQTELNNWLGQNKWFVIPLYLREHRVGLLLVDESDGLSKERESTLMTVANQAALALGTTILWIDRARRLAVETERNPIARYIHGTVAQSLFGIVYSLDACINMLPIQAKEVNNELIELRSLASSAHDEVRRSIFDLWPSPLTIELLMADLRNYVSSCCRPRSFSIIFNHEAQHWNMLGSTDVISLRIRFEMANPNEQIGFLPRQLRQNRSLEKAAENQAYYIPALNFGAR